MKSDCISSFVEKRRWLSLLFFVVLGLLIYSNTLRGPFVLDDGRNIQNNPHIRITRLTLDGITRAGLESPTPNRPVANVSFALNYYLHRYNIVGYHLVNILIHISTGILLYLFIKTTLSIPWLRSQYDPHAGIPFFAALIWLVHPIQTQSVSYIVQRMNSMSAMFYILAFLLYAKARLAEEKREKWALFVGCSVAGMLALGSKEIAATLPVLIFLYDWYFFQNLSSSWLKRHLVYAMSTFILLGLILFFYLGPNPFNLILSTYAYRDFTLTERLLTQFRVVVYYITLLAYPHPSRLNLDHDFQLSHSLIDPMTTLLSMGSIVSLIGLALLIAKKDRLLSFCILWFLGNLLIESSVLGLEIMFEHRNYLPSMFVTFMAVVLAYRHIRLEGARILVLCGVMMVCSLWTYQRNGVWGDDVALGRDCVEKSPNKARPHVSLGWALYKKGKVDEAISSYKKALSIEPESPKVHTNLGLSLAEQGDYDGAIVHYQRAIRSNPGYAEAHTSLGLALSEKGRLEKAVMHYKKALQIRPDFDRAHIAIGITLAKQGKLDVAIAHFFQTLAISPHLEEAHYNLGIAFAKKGQLEEAIAHYSKALRIKPNNADAHNNLGIVLARQGRFNDAISHFSQSLQIKPDFSGAQNNLKRARQLSRERE